MLLLESIGHWGKDDFGDVLKGALDRQKGLLPLEWFCRYGGFPSYEELSVHIDGFEACDSGVIIEVRCSVYFTEVVSSNCAVCSFEQPASGFLLLRINKEGDTDIQVI
ncbi:MAG: hypothetical protein HQL02_07445 [Nitrospirae bacterium]|nr:hypothetical protein [Nitrospirota bacterium]